MTDLQEPVNQKIIIITISLACFMASLDTCIVNIALPTISEWSGTDMGTVSWVVMAYLLAIAGLMLSFGRLGDLFGFRTIFVLGLACFTLGSLLCGLATGIVLLIAFRVIQGVGAAAMQAIAPAIIAVSFPQDKRGWALGILMTVVSFAIAAGPVLGGYITEYAGWEWIFFINVPIGILAVYIGVRFFPRDTATQEHGRFDTAGSILILAALTTLLFPISQGLYLGWTSPLILGSLAASVFFFVLFYVHEKRCSSPLIDMGLFSSPGYALGNIAGMLVLLVFAGGDFLLPFYFEAVRDIPTDLTGLFLAVPALALVVSGPVAGRLSDRYGPGGIMVGAAILGTAAMCLFSLFDTGTGIPFIIIVLFLYGAGIGLFVPPNMSLILGSGNPEAEGVASAVMMTLRMAGAMLGVAILGTIAMQGFLAASAGQSLQQADPTLLVPGFHAAFLAGIVLCVIVVGISVFLMKRSSPAK